MKTINCATLDGFDAKVVEVEVAFVRALPSFAIVGLAQASIQESRERVKSALNAIDFKFPPQKVTTNLSPSDLKKEGSHFDLPIALLIALQKQEVEFEEFMAFGELGLDGSLKDTSSIFAIILSLAKDSLVKKVIIPKDSLEKISKIPNLEIYTAQNLQEAIEVFTTPQTAHKHNSSATIDANTLELDQSYYYNEKFDEDFIDVKGQESAKRASLIAAAGMHNILYEGSAGCGKSMSAKRLRHILPPMSLDEILFSAKLSSLESSDLTFEPIRTFRSPHHSSSKASLFGGGSKSAMIGECGYAHNGILFFDELPHFSKSVLESLREPLEDHKILISRVNTKVQYPTKFLFVGAMNPCPCGNLLSLKKDCRCSDTEIQRYKNRLSSPLLDRIDIYVQMQEITPKDKATVSSSEMFELVKKAFVMQKKRGQTELNGKMSDKEVEKFCKLDSSTKDILDQATTSYDLSQRAIKKVLKLARTIADISESEHIKKPHLIEALSFRMKK